MGSFAKACKAAVCDCKGNCTRMEVELPMCSICACIAHQAWVMHKQPIRLVVPFTASTGLNHSGQQRWERYLWCAAHGHRPAQHQDALRALFAPH